MQPADSGNETKIAIRNHLRSTLAKIPQNEWNAKSEQLVQLLLKKCPTPWKSKTWVLYHPMPQEVSLLRIVHEGIHTAFVRVDDSFNRKMSMRKILAKDENQWETVQVGARQLKQPHASCPILPSDQSIVVFVSGLGFDRQGHRIGRGMGYYDRFLVTLPNAIKVGVGLQSQLLNTIPTDPWDVRMNAIITDQEFLEGIA